MPGFFMSFPARSSIEPLVFAFERPDTSHGSGRVVTPVGDGRFAKEFFLQRQPKNFPRLLTRHAGDVPRAILRDLFGTSQELEHGAGRFLRHVRHEVDFEMRDGVAPGALQRVVGLPFAAIPFLPRLRLTPSQRAAAFGVAPARIARQRSAMNFASGNSASRRGGRKVLPYVGE